MILTRKSSTLVLCLCMLGYLRVVQGAEMYDRYPSTLSQSKIDRMNRLLKRNGYGPMDSFSGYITEGSSWDGGSTTTVQDYTSNMDTRMSSSQLRRSYRQKFDDDVDSEPATPTPSTSNSMAVSTITDNGISTSTATRVESSKSSSGVSQMALIATLSSDLKDEFEQIGVDAVTHDLHASPDELAGFVDWAVKGSKHYQQKTEFEHRLENWKKSD